MNNRKEYFRSYKAAKRKMAQTESESDSDRTIDHKTSYESDNILKDNSESDSDSQTYDDDETTIISDYHYESESADYDDPVAPLEVTTDLIEQATQEEQVKTRNFMESI